MSVDFSEALRSLLEGRDLPRTSVESLFGQLMDGELDDARKAALLVALAAKGESVDEIAGAAAAMRQRSVKIPHRLDRVVDTCGTGGDGSGSFNVSTAAALVAAAAGVPIAKHGNRSVSSRSGSADVLRQLGLSLEVSPEVLGRCLEEVGIAFLFAPKLHPAMREVMPVRQSLGIRTLFNILGPLTNPASAKRQLMGVYSPALVEPLARVLLELGAEHALVVHGAGGLDEMSTAGETQVAEVRDGAVVTYTIVPEAVGVARTSVDDLRGGDPEENARRLLACFDGSEPALQEIVALNAGAAIWLGGYAESLAAGVEAARHALADGSAQAKIQQLVQFVAEAEEPMT